MINYLFPKCYMCNKRHPRIFFIPQCGVCSDCYLEAWDLIEREDWMYK